MSQGYVASIQLVEGTMGRVRNTLLALLLLPIWCLSASAAFADKRVALVIGNSAYDKVARLANPANDAALIADTFKTAGFDTVDLRHDLNVGEMRRALREFVDKSRDADVAVIYYAGHGIEVDGTNYLVPVDAALERDVDIYDEALSLDRVMVSIEPARQLRLVILDACRDNPFTRSMKRTLASRAVGRGLAKIETTSPNTLIAFASKAGSTASDGDSKNSPFTSALAKYLTKPGLDLRKAFGYVRDDVLKNTGNKQEPYVYGSLGGDDMSLVPAKPASNGPQSNPDSEIRRDYELALELGTREGWTAFLNRFPVGFYADLAKGQLNKIAAEETRAAAAEKARRAEEEKARLVAERAKKVEQDKAAATAKAAEEARLAAESTKRVEEAKAAAAEQRRKDAEAAAASSPGDKQPSEQALPPQINSSESDAKQATAKTRRNGKQNDASIAPVRRSEPKERRQSPERVKPDSGSSRPQASGQMVCGAGGCRPVKQGCRLEVKGSWRGDGGMPVEVCN